MTDKSFSVELKSIFNGMNSGIIVLDETGQIVCWNQWMTQYTGITIDQSVGQNLSVLFPELIGQRIYQVILNNIHTGLPAILSNVLNQSPFPLYENGRADKKKRIEQQINITRLNLADPTAIYCLINITNVSAARKRELALERQVKERKKIESHLLRRTHQLVKRTHQLQVALSASEAGVFRFDGQAQQLYLDEKASHLFSLDLQPSQNLYHRWLMTLSDKDQDNLNQIIQNAVQSEIGFKLDIEFQIQINKAIHWIKMQGVVGCHENKQEKELNGVLIDITKQKVHQDLLQSKQAAEIANRAKSLFLANITHELRTPMHGILSFSRLGFKRSDSLPIEKIKHYFFRISESGERLLDLLNDLLDLSKLEAGKMEMNFSKGDLLSLVRQAVEEQSARLDELNIEVDYCYQALETEGIFDALRISQVIVNFLSNAIKHSSSGDKITFLIRQQADTLELAVEDQGIGVPENELEIIFEKFQQGNSMMGHSGSTGLGLAICREIIEQHHGEIGVRNNMTGGACFYFRIPAIQQAQ